MPTVAVLLSGCGVFDGSEIHEAVAILYALDRRGAGAVCLAPEMELDEINHLDHKPTGKKRSVLMEAARIARGEITPLSRVHGSDFDAIVLPGGFGAASNLCTFAAKGKDCTVEPHTRRVLEEAHAAGKPIGFACISPALAAAIFGREHHPTLTIGDDPATASALVAMGARHEDAAPDAIIADEANRIVSTPCYMTARNISEVFAGADKLVEKILELSAQPAEA